MPPAAACALSALLRGFVTRAHDGRAVLELHDAVEVGVVPEGRHRLAVAVEEAVREGGADLRGGGAETTARAVAALRPTWTAAGVSRAQGARQGRSTPTEHTRQAHSAALALLAWRLMRQGPSGRGALASGFTLRPRKGVMILIRRRTTPRTPGEGDFTMHAAKLRRARVGPTQQSQCTK